MKTFQEIRYTYAPIDEKFPFVKEKVPHKIEISYPIKTNKGDSIYKKTLDKVYPSERHAHNDMENVRMPHYSGMRLVRAESIQEAEKKKEEKKYNENNLAIIQNIVAKNKGDKLKFKDETDVDCGVKQANSILATHARLSKENQKKLLGMLHQGKRHFIKAANFSQGNMK